jgi:hypothetical protein
VGELWDANDAGRAVERVTIAEAADLLSCHPNTVRSRVKAGMYRAEKVHTENGPTWMIERDSLTTNAPTSASQQGVSGVPLLQQEALQELAKAIVREAGLQSDPDKWLIEGGREFWKAQVDFFKHMSTVSAATIVAVPAVARVIFPAPEAAWLLYISVGLLLLGALVSIGSLLDASDRLAIFSWGRVPTSQDEQERKFISQWLGDNFRNARNGAYLLFWGGVLTFGILFVINAF